MTNYTIMVKYDKAKSAQYMKIKKFAYIALWNLKEKHLTLWQTIGVYLINSGWEHNWRAECNKHEYIEKVSLF